MFSIKHKEDNGVETVVSVVSVRFNGKELTGFGSPETETAPGGVVHYSSGYAYVMNEEGQTVAAYNLRSK